MIVHSQDVEQCRLPCSRWTHDRNKLTRLDVEANPSEYVSFRGAVGESFLDSPQTDHEIAPNPLSASSRFASCIARLSEPASSSTIWPSNKWTMRSACWA